LSEAPVITEAATAAVILQSIIEKKWKLEQGDRDRIVMIHKISYMLGDDVRTMQSYMVVDGEDNERTAMAKTVGLPLAIAIDLFLNDKIAERGVVIPTSHQLSNNILSKLKTLGIHFTEIQL
jgi:saccharopine dehydrogenase-like NADP-dependent oxidoreductase